VHDFGLEEAATNISKGVAMGKALPIILGTGAVAGGLTLRWMAQKMSVAQMTPEDEELVKTQPGGDYIKPEELKMHAGRAITIDAPPEKVYPYLKQLGCHKAGFYSYEYLERLFGYHIYNDYTIEQKWQDTKVGDWIPYRQNGAGTGVYGMKENEYLLTGTDSRKEPTDYWGTAWYPKGFGFIAWTWNFYTFPVDGGKKTRLVAVNDVAHNDDVPPFWYAIAMLIYGLTGQVMSGKMMEVLKGCAEGTYKPAERQKAKNALRNRLYYCGEPEWGKQ